MGLPDQILDAAGKVEQPAGRPLVTLSYAQSLDGSIAARKGERTQISGPGSAQLTHNLRANHDAIMIGIGTLLIDDPQLTVRLAEGENPRPVILDSKLRTPSDSLIVRSNSPWIATSNDVDQERAHKLISLGIKLIYLPTTQTGYIQLPALLDILYKEGIRTLMVEGGAEVLSSFLEAQLVDFFVLTLSPMILGGLPAIQFPTFPDSQIEKNKFLKLDKMKAGNMGEDLVIYGLPRWVAAS